VVTHELETAGADPTTFDWWNAEVDLAANETEFEVVNVTNIEFINQSDFLMKNGTRSLNLTSLNVTDLNGTDYYDESSFYYEEEFEAESEEYKCVPGHKNEFCACDQAVATGKMNSLIKLKQLKCKWNHDNSHYLSFWVSLNETCDK